MRHFLLATVWVWLMTMSNTNAAAMPFYIGTYTSPTGSQGVYRAMLDLETGELSKPELSGSAKNPSFVAIHPTKPVLYAALEIGELNGQKTGGVAAFSIDRQTGALRPLGEPQSSGGQGPCYVSIDASGRFAMVANYGGGSVAALPIGDDGSLSSAVAVDKHSGSGPNPKRQQAAFAHSIVAAPGTGYVLSADLGTDKIYVYQLDADHALVPAKIPSVSTDPGDGPRHIALHPNGKFVYVVTELTNHVIAYEWTGDTLKRLSKTPTLPADFTGNSTSAEVAVHPNGKFVYSSNRGHDSIAIFKVEANGALTTAGHAPSGGNGPRHFAIDPTGQYLLAAHQKTNNIVVFKIADDGSLASTGESLSLEAPVCVKFVQQE